MGKVSNEPVCGLSTHQTTPLFLHPHIPVELTTRGFLPELSPLELTKDIRVICETWRAWREPATCTITVDINQAAFSGMVCIVSSNLLVPLQSNCSNGKFS
ncbi:hypothetical protein AMECASPLE_037628 [Ameca splendens]|uniref:Uncharacterized protein n=1 Tax=Ameca splendens TaxID=208324 RepID=A0ABV1A6H9_9TELE